MSYSVHSNIVAATRSILAGNILSSGATTKQYFASKRTLNPGTAPLDAVWHLFVFGSFKTGTVAPQIMLNLEFNRSLIVPLVANLAPGIGIAKGYWNANIMVTRGDASTTVTPTGTIMANGFAGMSTTTATTPLSPLPFAGGLFTGIDWDSLIDIELSQQYNIVGANNSVTLEQMLWIEHRGI